MSVNIRNIAIIAHVDHGKTTLVDALLRQSGTFQDKGDETRVQILDSNPLEREKGITIFSKNASVVYQGVKVNIIDTPGHHDFGGEVERVLKMADGALLLVDAQEGPMPQTKYVLRKALQLGLRVIVVINKIDKPAARPDWVLNQTFDLFGELGATSEQHDFPVVYASGAQGKAGLTEDLAAMADVTALFEAIVQYIPAPGGDPDAPLQFLTVAQARDDFKGKLAIGRIYQGMVRAGQNVTHINRQGGQALAKVSAVLAFQGLGRAEVESAVAGDIVALAGIPEVSIGDTIADAERPEALPTISIDEPTVKMTFGVNTSPFAGREGKYTTSRQIRERLGKELETDVALRVEPGPSADQFIVSGRGELHLAILIETMRREGFELQVSKPQVILREEGGQKMEPVEEVFIEVPDQSVGTVMEQMGRRGGEMKDMKSDNGTSHLHFLIPTRGLLGYRAQILTDTKGMGVLHSLNAGFQLFKGAIDSGSHGSLIAFEDGESSSYGLANAQERGSLFIGSGVPIYAGLIVGQNAKDEDIEVNVAKEKKMTNIRSSTSDIAIKLTPPRDLSLEQCLEYIGDDELVEVTPKSLRLRKVILDHTVRKRASKQFAV